MFVKFINMTLVNHCAQIFHHRSMGLSQSVKIMKTIWPYFSPKQNILFYFHSGAKNLHVFNEHR